MTKTQSQPCAVKALAEAVKAVAESRAARCRHSALGSRTGQDGFAK